MTVSASAADRMIPYGRSGSDVPGVISGYRARNISRCRFHSRRGWGGDERRDSADEFAGIADDSERRIFDLAELARVDIDVQNLRARTNLPVTGL
jgi:hypothetical protein